jgi:hypothetical protein|tara:strand:- start:3882 stop:4049 length:168 start_codon:yes stop_codon:yes gene_type:complete
MHITDIEIFLYWLELLCKYLWERSQGLAMIKEKDGRIEFLSGVGGIDLFLSEYEH